MLFIIPSCVHFILQPCCSESHGQFPLAALLAKGELFKLTWNILCNFSRLVIPVGNFVVRLTEIDIISLLLC